MRSDFYLYIAGEQLLFIDYREHHVPTAMDSLIKILLHWHLIIDMAILLLCLFGWALESPTLVIIGVAQQGNKEL